MARLPHYPPCESIPPPLRFTANARLERVSDSPQTSVAALAINVLPPGFLDSEGVLVPVAIPLTHIMTPHFQPSTSSWPGTNRRSRARQEIWTQLTLSRNRSRYLRLAGYHSRRADLVLFGKGLGVNMWRTAEVYP